MPLWLIPVGLVVGYLYWRSHKPVPPAPAQPQQPPQVPQAPPSGQSYQISPTPAAPTTAPTIHALDSLAITLPQAPPGQVWAFTQSPVFVAPGTIGGIGLNYNGLGSGDGSVQVWQTNVTTGSSGGGSGAAILQLFNVNDTTGGGMSPIYPNAGATPIGQPVTINYSYAVP